MSIDSILVTVDSIADRIERAISYEDMFDQLGLGVLETDYDGVIVRMSRTFSVWLGEEDGDAVGSSFSEYLHPSDMSETMRCFSEDVPIKMPFFNRFLASSDRIVHLQWLAAGTSRKSIFAIARMLGAQSWWRMSGGQSGYGQ